jgi:hypothetical protein
MDPISIIVAALAAGAAAGLKPAAEQAVKDAYAGIKALIQRKYGGVDLSSLEKKPESETKRASVAEDLIDAGAAQDAELLERAKALLDAVAQHDLSVARAIGVDLEKVRAAALKIQEVTSEGTGVRVREGEFTGDIDIGTVQAGNIRRPNNPLER